MGKYNKLWILVLALLVCLAMGLSGCVTTGPQNEQTEPSQGVNDPDNGPGEVINSDQTASDKETLIRLLAAQGEFTITLEEDIKLDAPASVYGSKTLAGDKSIIMELWVPQYQHMLVVKKGASLTLDGATIDGNAAASCVKVEAGAKMELRSGEIIWGCPYGIEANGDVEITGGAIREAVNTGLYLRSGANGVMDGGKIIDGSYTGVKIEKAATMRISDDAVLVNNKFTLVWNNGKCDITGGEMHDGGTYLAYNFGDMTVKYTGSDANGKLEWYNAGAHLISQGKTGSLSLEGVHLKNSGWHGISSAIGSANIQLKDVVIDDVVQAALYLRCGAAVENVEVNNCGTAGVYVGNGSTVDIKNLSVNGSGGRGIWNFGGNVTASDVTITNVGDFGITSTYWEGQSGFLTVSNLTIDGVERDHAISANNSPITVIGGTVKNVQGSNKCGAYAISGGALTLKNVTFSDVVYASVYVQGANSSASLENITITGGKRGVACYDTGKLTGKHVVINETEEYSVACSNVGSVVELDHVQINNCKFSTRGAVNVGSSTVKLSNAKIVKPAGNGIDINENGYLTLNNATITEAGICGLNVIGGNVVGENVTIQSPVRYGIYAQKEKNVVGSTKINGLTIETTGDMGVSANGTVMEIVGGSIKNAGQGTENKCAGYVINGGKLTMKDMEITDAAYVAVYCENDGSYCYVEDVEITGGQRGIACYDGTVEGKNIVINDTASYAIASSRVGSKVELTGLEINNCQHSAGAVNVGGSNVTLTDVTILKPVGNGIDINENGVLTLTNATITEPGGCGLNIIGGNVTGDNVTITSAGNYGIYAQKEKDVVGKTQITGLTIDTTANMAISANGSDVEVTGAVIENAGKGTTNKCAAYVIGGGKLTLKDARITDAAYAGVYVENSGSYGYVEDVTVTGGQRGIVCYDGTVEGKAVTITGTTSFSITSSRAASKITLTDVTVTDCANSGGGAINVGGSVTELTDLILDGAAGHGINVDGGGKLTLKGAQIKNVTKWNGINVNGGTVTATDVTISNVKYNGIELLGSSTVTVDGLTVTGAGHNGVLVTGGTFETKNVNISGSIWHGIHVAAAGELKISEATFADNTLNPIFVEGGKATGENITIDSKVHGMAFSGGTVDLKGVTINTAGGHGVNIYNSANVTLSELTIKKATTHGINLETGSKLTLNGAQISNITTYNGIYVNGGTLAGSNVTITNPKYNGIEVLNGGSATVDGLTVTGAPRNGVLITKGLFDGKSVKVSGSGYHGIQVSAEGELKIDGAELTNCSMNGLFVQGGKVTGGNITTDTTYHGVAFDGGNVTLEGVTVKNTAHVGVNGYNSCVAALKGVNISGAADQAVKIHASANVTIDGLTIDGCKSGNAAVYVQGAIADISNATVGNISGHGFDAESGAALKINGVTVNSPKLNGIYVAGGDVSGSDVTINGPSYHGLAMSGGKANIEKLTVNDAGSNGIKIYDKAEAELTDLTVKNTKAEHGVYGLAGTTLKLNGATITGCKLNAIFAQGATVTGSNVIVDGAYNGLSVDGGNVTLDGLNISNVTNIGVTVYNKGTAELSDLTVSTAKVHGINVETGSKLTLDGAQISNITTYNGIYANGGTITGSNVTITNPKYNGIEVLNGGSVTLDGVTITGAPRNGILITKGLFDGKNVNISGSGWHGIHVPAGGELKISGATFANNAMNPIFVEGGKATGENITIDSKVHGMAFSGGTVDLSDVTINTAGGMGVNIYNSANVTLSELIIKAATTHGINIETGSKLTLNGAQISNIATYNGIYANGGTVTGSDVSVTNPKYNGIHALNSATVDLDGVTVTDANKNGVLVEGKANVTIKDLTVTNSKTEHGVNVQAGSQLTLNGTSTITKSALNAIFVKGGTLNGGGITTDGSYHGLAVEGGNVTLDGLAVMNANKVGTSLYSNGIVNLSNVKINTTGEQAVKVYGAANVTINGLQIDNCKSTNSAIYVDNATVSLSNTAIQNFIGTAHGINLKAGTLKLNGVTVTGAKLNGIFVENGTVTGGTVTIQSPAYYGLAASGGSITLNDLKVFSAARWAVNLCGKTTATLQDVEVNGTGWEAVRIGDSASLILTNATLKNWKTAAVKNETSGTYTPTNVTTQ